MVTVLTGAFGTQIPDLTTGRYLISVLDQLGYRASLQVITNYNEYDRKFYDSRERMQAGWFSWYQDYPARRLHRPVAHLPRFHPGQPG